MSQVGLVLESHFKATCNIDAGRGQVTKSGAETDMQNASDTNFVSGLKSVAPSGCNQWHRVDSVQPKKPIR